MPGPGVRMIAVAAEPDGGYRRPRQHPRGTKRGGYCFDRPRESHYGNIRAIDGAHLMDAPGPALLGVGVSLRMDQISGFFSGAEKVRAR